MPVTTYMIPNLHKSQFLHLQNENSMYTLSGCFEEQITYNMYKAPTVMLNNFIFSQQCLEDGAISLKMITDGGYQYHTMYFGS